MKRLFYIAIFLLTTIASGCEKLPEAAPAGSLVIENGASDIRLNCKVGDEVTLRFTAKSNWTITTSGSGFVVSSKKGVGSDEIQSVTITATEENADGSLLQRGVLSISLDGYSDRARVRVMQYQLSERVYIAYLFGTSLSYYLGNNIECMRKAVEENILKDERLLLFTQKSRSVGQIKEIYYEEQSKTAVIRTIAEIGLPDALTDEIFAGHLQKIMNIAPAVRYAMIVGGHSTAWLPAAPPSGGVPLAVGGMPYTPNWLPAAGAEVTRTVGENNMKLDIVEFASGLSLTGKHFDWIYFDVCFMSSLEAAYDLRKQTDYVIASPCEIMGYGSPYELMLDELVNDDLKGACEVYYNFYAYDYYGSKSGCIATIVCDELDALAATVKELNKREVATTFDITQVQPYEGRSAHVFFDAEHYVINAYEDDAAVAAFTAQLDKTVINRYHTQGFYSAFNARMNDVAYYSGVNFTPEDGCVAALEQQVEQMKSDSQVNTSTYSVLYEQLNELKHYLPLLAKTAWYKATH